MSAQIKDGGSVDVLAVLRGLCTRLDRVNLPGGDIPAQEAAALSVACCNTAYAVAELIEAARHSTPHLLEELRAHDASGRKDYPNLFNALRPLLAALDRVGGAQ